MAYPTTASAGAMARAAQQKAVLMNSDLATGDTTTTIPVDLRSSTYTKDYAQGPGSPGVELPTGP